MGSRWLTKSDVSKDVADISELDMYCVVGERPPPPRRSSIEDEEINQQFYGGMHNRGLDYDAQDNAPDLMGIQKMLQWVQQEDVSPNYSDEKLKQSRRETSVISIRKVVNKNNNKSKQFTVNINNQDVKPGQSSNGDKFLNNPVNVASCSKYPVEADLNEYDYNNSIPFPSNEDLSKVQNLRRNNVKNITLLNPEVPEFIPKQLLQISKSGNPNKEEIKLISNKLQSTILAASKENTYASKKARNVAMAALLKLHTSPAIEVSGENKQSLLLPPQFDSTFSNGIHRYPVDDLNEVKNKTEELAINEEPTSIVVQKKTIIHNPHKEMRDSISKVKNWLYGEEKIVKPKGPILTPVTFKKKEAISPKKVIAKSEQSSSSLSSKSFVPSEQAKVMFERFSENVKKNEISSLSMWDKLIIDLKAKDEVIRKQKEKKKSTNGRL